MKMQKRNLEKIDILDSGITKYNQEWRERYIHTEML